MIRVTLHDIAKEAGVSVATVSLALRGRGELSAKRVAEIRTLADRMGYRPNPMLAALASKRFSSAKSLEGTPIAIFDFPAVPGQPAIKKSHYAQTLMDFAKRIGYAPYHYRITEDTPHGPIFRQMHARSTQGIIITGDMDISKFHDIDWCQFAVVQCARYLFTSPFHLVRPNIFQSIKLAFNEVRKRGYKRIGCAIGRHPVLLEDDEDRFGTALSMESLYLPKKHRLPLYTGGFDDRPAFIKWFKTHRPDVVLGFTAAQFWALREVGINIPGDVGFALLHLADRENEIAGLIQRTDEIARQSIRLLDQLIRNHEFGFAELPMDILIPSVWKDGPSLRPA